MKNLIPFFFAIYLLVSAHHALAYKEATHENLSEAAAFSSALSKPETLTALGLTGTIDDPKLTFPNSKGVPKAIKFLIRDGAAFEDSGFKALSHFFNPVTNQPLTKAGISLVNNTSPDWALEDNGDILVNAAFPQTFSYKDARQYFYEALTTVDNVERNKKMGLSFQTLGQVIHHVQDMAQPQHVRNDAHLDQGNLKIFGLQLNPLYNPSLYEIYTEKVGTAIHPGSLL